MWIYRRISSMNCLKCRSPTLADVVAIPARNLDYDIARYDSLAAKPRVQREPGSHVEAVCLIVVHLGKVGVRSVLDDHVAGGTGAVPTACVLQVHSKVQADVENAFRLSMFAVRQLAGSELSGSTLRQEGDFWHPLSIAKRRTLLIHPILYRH